MSLITWRQKTQMVVLYVVVVDIYFSFNCIYFVVDVVVAVIVAVYRVTLILSYQPMTHDDIFSFTLFSGNESERAIRIF